jgi:hypothetical protein
MVPTVLQPARQSTYYATGAICVLRFASIRVMFDGFETFPDVSRKSWSVEIHAHCL